MGSDSYQRTVQQTAWWCPYQATKLGLVDGVVPKERLLAAARKWAAAIAAGTKPRNFSLYRSVVPFTSSY